jgi:hypothetical protein
MNQDQRVIFVATDISKDVNDFRAGNADFAYTAGQYLYIGSLLPFNNLWFQLSSLNLVTTVPTIEIWYNNAWTAAVDVIDETRGLKQSGRLQWNTHYDRSWQVEAEASRIPALASFEIYNFYWLRISWSVTMTASTQIAYIGQKFSDDAVLQSFYPDLLLPNVLASFETGKTDWDEQHYMAAEHIIRDLKKRNVIKARGQLLDHCLLTDASAYKVAEIVYSAMGTAYADHKIDAGKKYIEALDLKYFNVDHNASGRLEPVERVINTSFGTR